jgi:(R)-2-hydroxyacyl-CoA dehydratese activating ATPase
MADRVVTEITCHAAGARFLDPSVRSLIDIGGQDSKAIVMDAQGKVVNFAMNDKCAAGTGRFLEVMARALEADLDEFGALSLKAEHPAKISSLCTVFAESEVISLIAKGETRENIIAGIHEAIASRVSAMANRIGLTPPLMMTGGVARNIGVVRALEKVIGMAVTVSPHAQLTGAIGAAAIAREV